MDQNCTELNCVQHARLDSLGEENNLSDNEESNINLNFKIENDCIKKR